MDSTLIAALRDVFSLTDRLGSTAIWAVIAYVLVKFAAPFVFYSILARSVVTCVRVLADTSVKRYEMGLRHGRNTTEITV